MATLAEARVRALEYRRLAKSGLNPRYNATTAIPAFEEVARQVHIERLPTWKNEKHAAQWITTLAEYVFPRIGRLPVSEIGQPEVLACLLPIWTAEPEMARRLAQRIGTVLDVARSKGFRGGENPVSAIRTAKALPKVTMKPRHHAAMDWRDVPAFYAELRGREAMAAKALMLTCLTGSRTGEVLGARWTEFDPEMSVWTIPEGRMKAGEVHRVPLTDEMVAITGAAQGAAVGGGVRRAEAAPAAPEHGHADAPAPDERRGGDGARIPVVRSGSGQPRSPARPARSPR